MKKRIRRTASAVSAAAMLVSAVPFASTAPYSLVSVAADEYSVRDPFFNFRSDYHYYESEHFQFIWGNGADSSKVTQTFLERNAKNFEDCWNVYMNDLSMAPPDQSVEDYLRDGKKYKTNIYISGTGLDGMQDDWAYMSWDSGGFAYMFCCVDSMQYDPPSWVFPHEFGHVMTAHQRGWNNNKYSYAWWEAIGNWYREQYLYSDYSNDETGHGTDFFETYMKNLCFTFPCGRDYYASWAFLQYLTENPDNLEGYGADFVKKMLQEGQVDEYPFDQVERLAPADFNETLGMFAAHMAGLDFKNGDAYRARLNELLGQGDWNWQQIYTMLEPAGGNTYSVPTERAPQFAGLNIVPLEVSGDTITAELKGMSDLEGADWRACIVQQASDGKCTYSQLFKSGEKVSVPYTGGKAYLSVIACPSLDSINKYGLPGIYDNDSTFSEKNVPFSSKERYPYQVTFGDGISITKRTVSTTSSNWWEQANYTPHPNGGGLVASTAKVDSTVYVAPDAIVKGNATVTGNVKILDHAVVEGSAKVSDNAVIAGYGMVCENAVVSGNARVDDCGLVMGKANISGNARVIESACVYGNTTMTDYATAKGVAFLMANSSLSGEGAGDGDLYSDNNIQFTQGTSFGWTSAQAYASSRPYTSKLLYAYDFGSDSSHDATDRYTSTYALNTGAEWEPERTSAQGVLTFDGSSSLALDRSALYTEDMEIQLAVLDRDPTASKETLLYFGNSSDYLELCLEDNDIVLRGGLSASSAVPQEVRAENAVTDGKWTKVSVILSGGNATIKTDGNIVAQGAMTVTPRNVADSVTVDDSTAAYRAGADNNGENTLNGSLDFIRIFRGEVEEPSETYSGQEEVTVPSTDPGTKIVWGDADCDGEVKMNDVVLVMQSISNADKYGVDGSDKDRITPDGQRNANVYENADSGITVQDALLIQKYLLELVDSLAPEGME